MAIVGKIIQVCMVVFGLIGFLWLGVGWVVGVIYLVVKSGKNKAGRNMKLWALMTFGGVGLLVAVFIVYFLTGLISALLGVKLLDLTIPSGI